MRILVFSGLYPNAEMPQKGIFTENRLRELLARDAGITARVMAPVPWFPSRAGVFGTYARHAAVPDREERRGILIDHPRYLVIPRVGGNWTPWLAWQSARRRLRQWLRAGERFDLIDAHYLYPYGVAAAMLAREFGLPLVMTAHGSDVRIIAQQPGPKKKILAAAGVADGLVAVSENLADTMAALGIARERIVFLPSGVDTDFFRPVPADSAALVARLGLPRPILAMVANLIPLKGHEFVFGALARRRQGSLLIAGEGPERARLEQLARQTGLADRVHFLGSVPPPDVRTVFSAADVSLLASSSEGWPNVLLESMACGTPVVVAPFAGAAEIVSKPVAGRIAESRSVEGIAAALDHLLADPPAAGAVRAHALGFSWEPTTRGQIRLFSDILSRRKSRS